MSDKCYNPIKGIDDVIASKVQGWNKYGVATLRGLYEEYTNSPLDITNIDDAVQKLISYRKTLAKNNAESIKSSGSNLAETYLKLKESFSAEERFNRINMIAIMFSDKITAIQEANPSLSRKIICNGFTLNGKQVAGQFSIFEGVYDTIFEYYAEAVEEGDMKSANSYKKILENWGALVSYTRIKLRDTEELKLGNKIEYADDVNLDNYSDNKLSELYDASESKRESWQETSDMHSSYGLSSKHTKRFLSTIQKIENGEEVYDDLGFPIMIDPISAYQYLGRILRGAMSENHMMKLLKKASYGQSWINSVIEELENNNQLKTQFFVDFKKNFQLYSILKETIVNGLLNFKTIISNKVDKKFFNQYITNVGLGKQVNPKNSVFNKNGNINWENLQKLRKLILEYFPSKDITILQKFYNNKETTVKKRREVLTEIIEALGIDIDIDTLNKILCNDRDLDNFTNAITELVKYGTDKILTKSELEELDKNNFSLPNRSFKEFITFIPASSTSKEGVIREKINKIIATIVKNREGLKFENKVRHKDKKGNTITLYSQVIPSYLGDKMDKIANFVENNDANSIKKMIENEYLDSPYFKYEGNILCKWVEELYKSGLDEKDFAPNFIYKRFLGTDDNDFENFTSKKHAISMMSEYWSERQISPNSQYAYYPVFILGDSGVSKYIKAKRYSSEEILEGLYNVYRQEKRRMALTEAANAKLRKSNYSLIENFSKKANEYSLLTFLNKDYKSPDGTIGKYATMIGENPSKQEVMKAIQAYMEEATTKFKTQLNNLGLLETKEVYNAAKKQNETQYVYFNQEVKGNKTIDDVIKDYYWNTKFATIQQLQMFTIDPAFYNGTKDLQKRYKEIHAPGTVLSLDARDDDNNLYSEDGIERCVYFDDINLNAEDFNLEFMDAIKAKFGEKSSIYETYKNNTLTDGQGYRTLESYRKVMGMAGPDKWTKEMENVYQAIKKLRDKYGRDGQIPKEELAEIAGMAVVFQPIKPYMYTIENYAINENEKLKIPVQHKYAEAVLIPELLPANSTLRDMAYWMEDNNVDLVGSTKIVKVGGFGSTAIDYKTNDQGLYVDKDGNVIPTDGSELTRNNQKKNPNFSSLAVKMDKDSLNKQLSLGYVHQLSYSDYRIQTNVPEHINSSQLFGTQLRKLIMANIKMDDYHYENYVGGNKVNLGGKYGKVKLNGRNLISFYNSLIVANILESYDLFNSEISDIKTLSDMFIQNTINNSRESMDNMLAYSLTGDEKFLMPLFEGALEHDSAATLFSMFKKRVNKQSIKGGSAVQVSALGIKGYEKSGDLKFVVDPNNPKNILYAECEIPWDITYTDINGKEIALDYDDYCNEDGTLKTDENDNTLLEKKFPNALSIIAYRIPTERAYSMLNLKIKRFSRKTAGGTIKVPAQGTSIAGFDFDIDKLYFMLNEYSQAKLTDEQIEEIWNNIYKEHPEIKVALSRAKKENSEIQDSISEFFKSFYNSELAQDIAETSPTKDRLYKYWKEAGLEGNPEDLFSKYLEEHSEEYLTFESYDFNKSPLENTSRAARNNMLIKLIQERLMDYETFDQRYTPGGFANASKAARNLRELLFGDLEGIISKDTSTSKISGENISSKGSEFARKLTNPGNNLTVTYKGVTFRNAEHAYQTWKSGEFDSTAYNSNDFIPRGSKPANRQINFQIMVDILTEKLKQHPELIEGIKERGGYEYIISSTHNVRNDKYWETSSGQNAFIKALAEAAINVGISPINNSSTKSIVDFDAIAERAKDKKSDPEPNYDPSDPMTMIIYNQQNQVAGKLIGIFANQNTNQAFASLMKEFTLKEPIKFAGHSYYDLLHAPSGVDVDLNVAELLSASVDAVKDPVLNFLNLNTITANAGALLARIGYTSFEIGLLFNQPIIKEICEYSFNNDVTVDMAIREVVKSYTGDNAEELNINSDKDFSANQLALNIVNDRVLKEQGKSAMNIKSFKENQLKVVQLFSQITTVAEDVNQFVTSTKFTASNAVGSTFGDLYSQQMKVKNYIDRFIEKNGKNSLSVNMKVTDTIQSPITNDTDLYASNQDYLESLIENPFAYEQAMYDMNRRVLISLNKYYPYETLAYKNARTKLASLTKGNFLDAGTINSIHSDMLVYMLAQQEDSLFNGEIPTKDGIPAREYYTKHFAKELFNALEDNPELKDNPIFNYMQFITDEKTNNINIVIQEIGGIDSSLKDKLKEGWAELYKTEPDLARDLFIYNFYKLGFTFSPLSFMNLAPTELKLAIKVGRKWDSEANNGEGAWVERSYIDFLNDVLEGNVNVNSNKFAKQYILNHLDNKKLVFKAKGSTLKELKKLVYKNNEAVSSFTLNATTLGDDAKIYTINDPTIPKKHVAFRPCIIVDDIVYMCESGNDKFNVSADGSITYYKVSKLGTTNKSLQYISDSETKIQDSQTYDDTLPGSTSTENGVPDLQPEIVDRNTVVNDIIKYALEKRKLSNEEVEKLKNYIDSLSDTELKNRIESIKKEVRENGVTDKLGIKTC